MNITDIMRALLFTFFSIIVLCAGCSKDSGDTDESSPEEKQVTLYDKNKEAIAYIDFSDEATIYTFEGQPSAYIESKELVYGFNGKLLGWYENGVLYDRTCYAVGAKHGIVRGGINTVSTFPEKVKGIKKIKPVKHVEELNCIHSILKDSWSETTLKEFLNAGIQPL